MSPKIVNGSFAAIYDSSDILDEYKKTFSNFRVGMRDSPCKFSQNHRNSKKFLKIAKYLSHQQPEGESGEFWCLESSFP